MRRFVLVTLALALVASTAAFAGPVKKGVYIGGSIGQAAINLDSSTPSIDDEEDFAYKLYAGYRAASFFAVEGGYRDLGSVDDGMGAPLFSAETTAFDAAGVGIIKLGIVDIFGKVGVVFWDTDFALGSDSGSNAIYGLGVGVRLGGLGIRLEWELLDIDAIALEDLDMVSVGVTWTF